MAIIQGIWKFHAAPAASAEVIIEDVSFVTTDGYDYDAMICYTSGGTARICYGDISLVVYNGSYGWDYEEDRTIDFGETPQTVSDAFYAYITQNADALSVQEEATPPHLYVRSKEGGRLYAKVTGAGLLYARITV